MIRILTAILLLFAVSLQPLSAAEPMPYGQGLLWKVEKEGFAPSHLFGTFHVTENQIKTLPGPVKEVFDQADSAVFEIILNPAVEMEAAKLMFYLDGRTLDQAIGPDLFARAVEIAADYGVPGEALKLFKPWALLSIFAIPPEEAKRQATGEAPLDQWLQQIAAGRGTPLHQLETPAEQLAYLANMPEEDQLTLVRSTIESYDEIRDLYEEMKRLYLERDIAAIAEMMTEASTPEEESAMRYFQDEIIDARNRLMAERLPDYLAAGNAFVAVGAMHLPGELGVLRLLEEQGYSISRVY